MMNLAYAYSDSVHAPDISMNDFLQGELP